MNKKARITSLPPLHQDSKKIADYFWSFCVCETLVGVERWVMLAFGLLPIKELALQVRESDSQILISLYSHMT